MKPLNHTYPNKGSAAREPLYSMKDIQELTGLSQHTLERRLKHAGVAPDGPTRWVGPKNRPARQWKKSTILKWIEQEKINDQHRTAARIK